MDNRERRDREMAYIADAAVNEEMRRCRKILQKLNFMDRSDFEGVA
ncbi:MAG TPA: sugar O-acetyltransferase, partial [Lachnoclostridium sp.]|nr:sugar O-acetyltransferase [Lachnoclostridium sp.]